MLSFKMSQIMITLLLCLLKMMMQYLILLCNLEVLMKMELQLIQIVMEAIMTMAKKMITYQPGF